MTAAAILAGGQASRMGGRAKSFLLVDGQRIIDRQLAVLRPLFAELILVANDPAPYAEFGLPVVADAVPGRGPLAGILAALEAAAAPDVLVVACDMPYLLPAALRLIATAAPEADAVVPVVAGRPEPLCARYSRRCAPALRARLAAGADLAAARLLDDVAAHQLPEAALRAVDPELRTLVNCNSPADLI